MSEAAPNDALISDAFIADVCGRLEQNRQVRRTLSGGGRLHIDRPVPFLVLYRQPTHEDKGTDYLVTGGASYLVVRRDEDNLEALLLGLIQTLSNIFGAFLLLELWSAPRPNGPEDLGAFKVITPDAQTDADAVAALVEALSEVGPAKNVESKEGTPPGLPLLISSEAANHLRCFRLALEVPLTYRSEADILYPERLRTMREHVTQALKKTFFAFMHARTQEKVVNYQSIGRRAVVSAVNEVDKVLTSISSSFDFLLSVTPLNMTAAWRQFKQGGFSEQPEFRYRPLEVEPDLLKRQLYLAPLEAIEDPTLARIFREKQRELGRQLTMLAERNTHRFIYESLQLYGELTPDLVALAEDLLATLPHKTPKEAARIDAGAFVARATQELNAYRNQYPELGATAEVREDITGLMVSQGKLLVSTRLNIAETRAEALLQHEVGTHILTYANGAAQPFGLLRTGLAGYEALQEGLAVLAEYLVGGLSTHRLRLLAARVVAVKARLDKHSFADVFELLTNVYGFKPALAFRVVSRVFRGGGLTKDAIYLQGLAELLAYLKEGHELEPLLLGKFALQHVAFIEELRYRHILREPPLTPSYLNRPEVAAKLTALKKGRSLLDLIPEALAAQTKENT